MTFRDSPRWSQKVTTRVARGFAIVVACSRLWPTTRGTAPTVSSIDPRRRPGWQGLGHDHGSVPRELEWLQRRHEGEPVAQIAARAGVTSLRVRAATDPFGPFPDPVQERHREWVALRRGGVRVTEIARAAGISHQAVSKATADHGPFPQPVLPSEEQVAQWVARRREGVTITQLAEESGITRFVISAATRAFGPFPRRARRMPDGAIALGGIATRLGVTKPTVTAWQRSGFLPDPDFTTATGRRLWLTSTIDAWIPTAGLTNCDQCGARVRVLSAHQALGHRRAAPQNPG